MNVIGLSELYNRNYSLNVINALKQYWNVRNSFGCIGEPKVVNMLLYIDGLEAEYTLKDGSKLRARMGDLVYIPVGSEYSTVFFNRKNESANTVGINFFMYDEDNTPAVLGNSIEVFKSPDCAGLINKISAASNMPVPCFGQMKAGMYDLLTLLGEKQKRKSLKGFNVIEKGICYMEENSSYDMSIKEIAGMCNVSEGYFRRLFKEYSGLSPVDYRIKRKIEKAKSHLVYDNLNVSEIADLLNFTDSAYFCKCFKMHTGFSPLEYKNKN